MRTTSSEFENLDISKWFPTPTAKEKIFETIIRTQPVVDKFAEDFQETIPRLVENPPSAILLHVYTPPGRYNFAEIGTDDSNIEMNPLKPGERTEGDYILKGLFDYLNDISRKGRQLPTILIAGGHPTLHGGHDTCELYARRIKELQERFGINFSVITETERRNSDTNYELEATDTRGELRFLDYMAKNEPELTGKRLLCLGRLPHMARIEMLLEGNQINAETLNIESLIGYYHQNAFRILQSLPKFRTEGKTRTTIENLTQFRRRELLLQLFVRSIDYNGAIMEWLSKRLGSKRKTRIMENDGLLKI